MKMNSKEFYEIMNKRRTVREFSCEPVDREVIKNCVLTAGTAPSGANMQPWRFEIIFSQEIKRRIREEAEKVEREFYEKKAPKAWKEALTPLETNFSKPFLEDAPCLIGIFLTHYHLDEKGNKIKHYYVRESVGLAVGMLITSLHLQGLSTLTYTPSPMLFLREICHRPENEVPFMILVTGKRSPNYSYPKIERKKFSSFAEIKD